ncbi:hypothetical protein QTP88_005767 [Uroleucon formosanum]
MQSAAGDCWWERVFLTCGGVCGGGWINSESIADGRFARRRKDKKKNSRPDRTIEHAASTR